MRNCLERPFEELLEAVVMLEEEQTVNSQPLFLIFNSQ
jgi:hypothetical protein